MLYCNFQNPTTPFFFSLLFSCHLLRPPFFFFPFISFPLFCFFLSVAPLDHFCFASTFCLPVSLFHRTLSLFGKNANNIRPPSRTASLCALLQSLRRLNTIGVCWFVCFFSLLLLLLLSFFFPSFFLLIFFFFLFFFTFHPARAGGTGCRGRRASVHSSATSCRRGRTPCQRWLCAR